MSVDLRLEIERAIGCDKNDFTPEHLQLLLIIAKGMLWTRVLYLKAQLLAEEIKEDMRIFEFK